MADPSFRVIDLGLIDHFDLVNLVVPPFLVDKIVIIPFEFSIVFLKLFLLHYRLFI